MSVINCSNTPTFGGRQSSGEACNWWDMGLLVGVCWTLGPQGGRAPPPAREPPCSRWPTGGPGCLVWHREDPRLGLARRAGFEKQFFSFCFGFQVFVLFILFFYFCCLMEGKLTLVIDHWTDRDPVENS